MVIDSNLVITLLPELLLVVTAVVVILGNTFAPSRNGWATVSAVALGIAALMAIRQTSPEVISGPLMLDSLGINLRWISLGLGVLFVLVMMGGVHRHLIGESLGLLLLVFVGLVLVCIAGDIILLFLGLELISIPTYVLLFVGRRDRDSAEAATKYFFLSILASAMLLYGFSLLYGITGDTELLSIQVNAATLIGEAHGTFAGNAAAMALVLILAGTGFKMAAVPFHFYAPDVYQATTNANAGLLAVVPKIAGVVATARLLTAMLPAIGDSGWQILLVMSLITMTLGNICALWQTNVRRLMAYSSIAHSGYLLIGLAVGSAALDSLPAVGYGGFAATMLYVIVYAFASLGTFAVLAQLGTHQQEVSELNDLSGLSERRPWMAAALAIFMFSLSGIPPLAGFWGKLTLFSGALSTSQSAITGADSRWFLVLAVVGVLNAAVAAAYYLRVVGVVYFGKEGRRSLQAAHWGPAAGAGLICAAVVLFVGVFPGRTMQMIRPAGQAAVMSTSLTPNGTVELEKLVDVKR